MGEKKRVEKKKVRGSHDEGKKLGRACAHSAACRRMTASSRRLCRRTTTTQHKHTPSRRASIDWLSPGMPSGTLLHQPHRRRQLSAVLRSRSQSSQMWLGNLICMTCVSIHRAAGHSASFLCMWAPKAAWRLVQRCTPCRRHRRHPALKQRVAVVVLLLLMPHALAWDVTVR